jgi:hypothetical protein
VVVVDFANVTAAVLRNTMNYSLDDFHHRLAREGIQTRVDLLRNTMNYYLDGFHHHLLAWEGIQTRVDASRQVGFAYVKDMMLNLHFDGGFRLAWEEEEGMPQFQVDAS